MANYILTCLTFSICLSIITANDLARGWGDAIDWVSLEDGLTKAKSEQKPLMVIIHKSWCGACKALKPKFGSDKEIADLSHNFVMVNTQDEEEPNDSQYMPDGGYIPRVLFLDFEGKVQTEFHNEAGSDKYKYYYPIPQQIAATMKKVSLSVSDGTFGKRPSDEL